MSAVAGSDSATIASLCAEAAARLHAFDTQSLVQLFCASVKHAHVSHFFSFVSAACKQLTLRVATMDGISAGCLAGALATASQNVSERESCYSDLRACLIALCSRWLVSPSLVLGPQHTAFMCRCLVSSLDAVRRIVGDQLSVRGIRRRVVNAVAEMVADMNWFCVAHVELLLILLSHSGKSHSTEVSWLRVANKHKSILKVTRHRMFDATVTMLSAYDAFDREAAGALLDAVASLPVQGVVLMCGSGGPGKPKFAVIIYETNFSHGAGDEIVKDCVQKGRENVRVVSWCRSLGAQAIVSPWLTLDSKCDTAFLRHPGCSSSCAMLVHMAISGHQTSCTALLKHLPHVFPFCC
jgi:hypothetical protein